MSKEPVTVTISETIAVESLIGTSPTKINVDGVITFASINMQPTLTAKSGDNWVSLRLRYNKTRTEILLFTGYVSAVGTTNNNIVTWTGRLPIDTETELIFLHYTRTASSQNYDVSLVIERE